MHRLLIASALLTALPTAAPLALAANRVDQASIEVVEATDTPVAAVAADAATVVPAVQAEAATVPVEAEIVTVGLRPEVTVRGADADEQVRVDEALARFRRARLALPDVEIVFHDDEAECGGHDGLFQRQFTPWRVLVCSGAEFVVTHELAHAWEAANLDDADREAYRIHRHLETWSSTAASWRDRAVEDAAFMVQQNLMAGTVDLTSDRWTERLDAYETLTGRPSPLLGTDGLTAW